MKKISKQGRGYRASSFDIKCEITHKINKFYKNKKVAQAFRSYLQPLLKREDYKIRIVEIFRCLEISLSDGAERTFRDSTIMTQR